MRGNAAGYTEWLLFHLWKQNESTGQSCPYVLVPETVIYRWGQPFFWYFTTHTGELLRKSKNKVTHKFILQEFAGGAVEGELVASYLSFQDEETAEGTSTATSHFFTKASFGTSYPGDFIVNRPKALSGVLQKWVEPKGGRSCTAHAAMIKVMWSPLLAVMERRTNLHMLQDDSVDFYERLATYEGLEAHSRPESLTVPQLVSDVQKICASIVDHVKLISGGNVSITRLTLYFKQDPSDRLWLLFCGGVQIFDLETEKSKGPTAELSLSLPASAVSKRLVKGLNYFELQANRTPCPGCNYLTKAGEMYDIAFDLLIKCCETGFPDPPSIAEVAEPCRSDEEQATDEVPRMISRAVPDLTNEKYRALRRNLAWLNTTTKVCETCYLHFSGFVVFGKPKEGKKTLKAITRKKAISRDEDSPRDFSSKKSFSLAKSRLFSPTSFVSSSKTAVLRSHLSYYQPRKPNKEPKPETPIPKLEGHFTAKKLPALIQIYSNQSDLSHSTRTSSHNSSHRHIRLSELSPPQQHDVIRDTIKSLKMCLLDGVKP